jgi:rod shape determining protein RodA
MTLLAARDPAAPLSFELAPLTRRRTVPHTDWVLVGLALALSLIGAVLVWSATKARLQESGGNPQSYLYRHLLNIAVAALLVVITSRFNARVLRILGPIMYGLSLLGLCAVFAIGSTINGAHAWIRLGGGFELQPAEFMKLGLIVGLAVLLSRRGSGPPRVRPNLGLRPNVGLHPAGRARISTPDLLIALALIVLPLGLIMLQPDLGSAMVLACAGFGVLVAAGISGRWTIALVILGVAGVVLALKAGVLADYQLARFRSLVDPNSDLQGAAYNVNQAHIAIAHGGLWGQGLFHGSQTQGAFVPEQQTDFVFSVAGEELGFAGGTVIIGLIALLCWRGLRIAASADRTGRLLAVGIVCWFAFQAFQNIGMNLGLTPVTGLPLPFVSYGGSSMFAQGIAIGLLLSVRRRASGA